MSNCGSKCSTPSVSGKAPTPAGLDKFDFDRRRFLSVSAAAAGVILAPGVMLYGVGASAHADHGADANKRWGMLIDVNKCEADCDVCVHACADENGWQGTHDRPTSDAQWIRKVTVRDPSTDHTQTLPVMCQHCAEPPCVDVCPTGASFKRVDGIVLVDKHICIGCRYCMVACPYKARSFVHEDVQDQKPHAPRGKGTVESCNMCVHRVDEGGTPACVEACASKAGGAMMFGDLNDPESDISKHIATYATRKIRADLGVDPGVRYQNL